MDHTKPPFRSNLSQDPRADTRMQTTALETLPVKVEALEEKLEEVKNFKNLVECIMAIDQRFASVEGMMKQLLELHGRSAPVAEAGLAIKDAEVDSRLRNQKMPIFEGEDVHQCETGTSSVSNTNDEQLGSNLKHVTESEPHNKQAKSKRRPRGKKKLAPEPSQVTASAARLSLVVLSGTTSDSLLMYRGEIGEHSKHSVTVVIGTGTTHNFISDKVVDKLGIKVTTTEVFDVDVGLGTVKRSRGVCKRLDLAIQGVKLRQDFIPFRLIEHVDVVLGMAWLETIGHWKVSGRPSVIEFLVGNRRVKLHRDPSFSHIKW